MDRGSLVRWQDPERDLDGPAGREADERSATHLHISLDGFIDAGGVGAQVSAHLLDSFDGSEIARFDTDALIDYRGRRPTMTFSANHWSNYDAPEIVVHRMLDGTGVPFLLLHGAEPDFRWEAFADAVVHLCRELGVRTTSSAHGIPMAVPHTRPIGATPYAGDPSTLTEAQGPFGEVTVPGSAEALLHLRLTEEGLDTFGVAVHVPHYLANTVYAEAAVVALESIAARTGWAVPLEDLRAAADSNRADIASEVEGSAEVRQVVEGLERSYDRFMDGQARRSLLAAEAQDLPSAEEIGAEFEQFLSTLTSEDSGEESAGGDTSGGGGRD